MSDQIRGLLEDWARWARRDGNLGYPKQSPIQTAIDAQRVGFVYGGEDQPKDDSGRKAKGHKEIYMPEHVERVELAVCALALRYQTALKLRYLKPWLTDRDRAKEMTKAGHPVTARNYRDEVKRAELLIEGTLTGMAIQEAG